ncbi:cobalt uptake protein COT1 isoform X4 [Orussus abietinus]|uniref:cobalt uptake protein COT1 isoform X4 n=1 Tax=Orussus abietinus TaxID=222816 RepID=UPI000625B40E|nr:cobalt uptake protein COT1 isoform X4 [Orussus abietinus]
MAVKEWFRRLQPVQLYLVLFLTTAFFIVEIVASYVTHALTLLLNAYHMLCNIIALVGCIASIKQSRSETTMKNTFGWARFDILSMLVCCVFLASFCFSLLVEALQTLVHIDHLDEMHLPLPVMCIGAAGILLNAFCYILIGGYMFNQDIFVHVTENGDVMLRSLFGLQVIFTFNFTRKPSLPKLTSRSSNFYHSIIAHGFLEDFRSTRLDRLKFDGNVHFKPVSESDPQRNAATERRSLQSTRTQGLREMFRDVLGCIFVIVTSIIVYLTDANVAKYVDPVFAIISAISLLALSYPYKGILEVNLKRVYLNIESDGVHSERVRSDTVTNDTQSYQYRCSEARIAEGLSRDRQRPRFARLAAKRRKSHLYGAHHIFGSNGLLHYHGPSYCFFLGDGHNSSHDTTRICKDEAQDAQGQMLDHLQSSLLQFVAVLHQREQFRDSALGRVRKFQPVQRFGI